MLAAAAIMPITIRMNSSVSFSTERHQGRVTSAATWYPETCRRDERQQTKTFRRSTWGGRAQQTGGGAPAQTAQGDGHPGQRPEHIAGATKPATMMLQRFPDTPRNPPQSTFHDRLVLDHLSSIYRLDGP